MRPRGTCEIRQIKGRGPASFFVYLKSIFLRKTSESKRQFVCIYDFREFQIKRGAQGKIMNLKCDFVTEKRF